jgi:aldose 1-epimerase
MSFAPILIDLNRGDHAVGVLPDVGGGLTYWRWQTDGGLIDLLRPTDGHGATPLDLACFPLLPYSNRIRNGEFRFQGRAMKLPLNFGDHPHSIHGHGWQRSWTIERHQPDHLVLAYSHAADAWPFDYTARQTIDLHANGLSLSLDLENRSNDPMPAGLGFHPYFPCAGKARIVAPVDGVWLTDATQLPTTHVAPPAKWHLSKGRAVAGLHCDHVFTGWTGVARILWPNVEMTIHASEMLRHLVVYAPSGADFFCLEPVSHQTDAVNAHQGSDTGLRILAPGETLHGKVDLRV